MKTASWFYDFSSLLNIILKSGILGLKSNPHEVWWKKQKKNIYASVHQPTWLQNSTNQQDWQDETICCVMCVTIQQTWRGNAQAVLNITWSLVYFPAEYYYNPGWLSADARVQ